MTRNPITHLAALAFILVPSCASDTKPASPPLSEGQDQEDSVRIKFANNCEVIVLDSSRAHIQAWSEFGFMGKTEVSAHIQWGNARYELSDAGKSNNELSLNGETVSGGVFALAQETGLTLWPDQTRTRGLQVPPLKE